MSTLEPPQKPLVLLDLDQTLVDTTSLKPFREARDWTGALAHLNETQLIPDAQFLIAEIRRLNLSFGIVTSSPRDYAEALVAHHKLDIPVVVAYHDTKSHKPDPEPILLASEKLGNSGPKLVIYVGDDERDEVAARAAGAEPATLGRFTSSGHLMTGLRAVSSFIGRYVEDTLERHGQEGPKVGSENRSIGAGEPWKLSTQAQSYFLGQCGFADSSSRMFELQSEYLAWWGAAIHYHPRSQSETAQAAHDLTIRFKEGNTAALDLATGLIGQAIYRSRGYLRDQLRIEALGVIPGHEARVRGPQHDVADKLREAFPWLNQQSLGVIRETAVLKASHGPRTSMAGQVASLRIAKWGPDDGKHSDYTPVSGVLWLDDVRTKGETTDSAILRGHGMLRGKDREDMEITEAVLQQCRDRAAAPAAVKRTAAVYLAKTMWPGMPCE
jgi:hypothetical protein